MIDTKLNLARKLRCKNFDQIIGQTLSVRMLKNSLYLGHYFPVYLFSGQRGCGKTTTARVFSSALNCKDLENFQKNPKKYTLPCMVCDSCSAMLTGTHPDFIEMDAASHTGVDNVRQIIDAASLLPVMGVKKIYLIDEAHMLSKAAFNALLKILEEPPANVIFILATTDTQKIIDTVKSRCFQLLFKAVDEPVLLTHLQEVCATENIPYESAGLSLIIHETRGSVRDALNVVEQVRFSSGTVTAQAVLRVLDHLDTGSFVQIIEFIFTGNARDMLIFLKKSTIEHFCADYIWRRFIELIRSLLWLKYGVRPHEHEDYSMLNGLVQICSLKRLNAILQHIYNNEELFLKTTAQHLFLEMFFLQLCQDTDGSQGGLSTPPHATVSRSASMPSDHVYNESEGDDSDDEMQSFAGIIQQQDTHDVEDTLLVKWHRFVSTPEIQQEPLLNSVLSQGVCMRIDADGVVVQFAKELSFFESVIQDERALWSPHFHRIFSPDLHLIMNFTGESKVVSEPKVAPKIEIKKVEQKKVEHKKEPFVKGYQREQRTPFVEMGALDEQSSAIDISDSSVWKTTHMVLHHFPGLVREVQQ